MSDLPAWAGVGLSCLAFTYTALVDRQRRHDVKREERQRRDDIERQEGQRRLEAKRVEQAVVNDAITRLVAQWTATRIRTVTAWEDPDLNELKRSAQRWRENCGQALAVVPQSSRAHDLVEDIINAASAFEQIIDRMLASGDPLLAIRDPNDKQAVQDGLTHFQASISNGITKLTALSLSADRAASNAD